MELDMVRAGTPNFQALLIKRFALDLRGRCDPEGQALALGGERSEPVG